MEPGERLGEALVVAGQPPDGLDPMLRLFRAFRAPQEKIGYRQVKSNRSGGRYWGPA